MYRHPDERKDLLLQQPSFSEGLIGSVLLACTVSTVPAFSLVNARSSIMSEDGDWPGALKSGGARVHEREFAPAERQATPVERFELFSRWSRFVYKLAQDEKKPSTNQMKKPSWD